jgi:hypothetical protein
MLNTMNLYQRLTALTIRIAVQFRGLSTRMDNLQATSVDLTAVNARIEAIVGAAPAALDTLGEIATALSQTDNLASALTQQVSGKASIEQFLELNNTVNQKAGIDQFLALNGVVQQKADVVQFLELNNRVLSEATRVGVIEDQILGVGLGDLDLVALFEQNLTI